MVLFGICSLMLVSLLACLCCNLADTQRSLKEEAGHEEGQGGGSALYYCEAPLWAHMMTTELSANPGGADYACDVGGDCGAD